MQCPYNATGNAMEKRISIEIHRYPLSHIDMHGCRRCHTMVVRVRKRAAWAPDMADRAFFCDCGSKDIGRATRARHGGCAGASRACARRCRIPIVERDVVRNLEITLRGSWKATARCLNQNVTAPPPSPANRPRYVKSMILLALVGILFNLVACQCKQNL